MNAVKFLLPSILFSLMSIAVVAQNEDMVTSVIKGNVESYALIYRPSDNFLMIINANDPYAEASYDDYYAREIKGYYIESITKDKEFVNRYLKDAFVSPSCKTSLLIYYYYDLKGNLLSISMSSDRKNRDTSYDFPKLALAFEQFEAAMKMYSKANYVKSTENETEIKFVRWIMRYDF